MIRALWTLLRALRGAMPDPRVAEAVRQQRAVAGDTHSRKVDPVEQFSECFADGNVEAAADWLIRATQ